MITKGTKLGVHAILPAETPQLLSARARSAQIRTDTLMLAASKEHGVPIVKAVADVGWLRDVKAVRPDCITLGRFIDVGGANVESANLCGDLAAEAARIMGLLMPVWATHRAYVDYWEVLNEQDPGGSTGHAALARFYIECIKIANANGYKLAIFSYSYGVPEIEEWAAIVETGVFAAARDGGHILALHEYAYPVESALGWHALRYRKLYEQYLIPRGEVIPLIVTEFGLLKDIRTLTLDDWLRNVAQYDDWIAQDWYVLGATIFTLTNLNVWQDYNFGPWVPALDEYIQTVAERQNATGPEPEPEPEMTMLKNGGMEGGWTRDTWTGVQYSEIVVPEGWTAFWKEGELLNPADPNTTLGRPEMQVINKEAPFLDPPRVYEGNRALKYFTYFRCHNAGLMQTIATTPGKLLTLSGKAHAWFSQGDNAHKSEVLNSTGTTVRELKNGDPGMSFRLGIDPAGGRDPYAASVVWGPEQRVYNVYEQLAPLAVKANGATATVFVRSVALWPFKHCDAYVDAITLTESDVAPEPSGEVELGPQTRAILSELQESIDDLHDELTLGVAEIVAELKAIRQALPASLRIRWPWETPQ